MTIKQREEAQSLLKTPITFHMKVLEDGGKQTAAASTLQGLILLILQQKLCGLCGTFGGSDYTTEGEDGPCTVPVVQEGRMNLCHSQHLSSCQQAPGLVCSVLSHTETQQQHPSQSRQTLMPSLVSSSPGAEKQERGRKNFPERQEKSVN